MNTPMPQLHGPVTTYVSPARAVTYTVPCRAHKYVGAAPAVTNTSNTCLQLLPLAQRQSKHMDTAPAVSVKTSAPVVGYVPLAPAVTCEPARVTAHASHDRGHEEVVEAIQCWRCFRHLTDRTGYGRTAAAERLPKQRHTLIVASQRLAFSH